MTQSPSPEAESLRPQTAQTVSVNVYGDSPQSGSRRYNLQLRECVETKTITTTTRLTREYPHVLVRDPTPLACLDTKEYPLAMKPTPPELANFTYSVQVNESQQPALTHPQRSQPMSREASLRPQSPDSKFPHESTARAATTHDSARRDSCSRGSSASPSENVSSRTRLSRSSRPASPSAGVAANLSLPPQRCSRSSHSTRAASDTMRRSLHGAGGTSAFGASATSQARPSRSASSFLVTPDTSELVDVASERHARRRPAPLDRLQHPLDDRLGSSIQIPCNTASPTPSDAQTIFGSNVATPPITDGDTEPFTDSDDALQHSLRANQPRSSVHVAAQDASLPSPRLSPTLAAAQLHAADASSLPTTDTQQSLWQDESLEAESHETLNSLINAARSDNDAKALVRRGALDQSSGSVVDPQTLLDAFDSMQPNMKNYMMYQFLRRCSRPMLRVIANAVNPALKCDFLHQLPLELSYHVLSYLDFRDLCRAAQVSKRWRNITDRNETGWKELFDRDGYRLPPGELEKAVLQGWGWQDPVGAMGFERDLSMQSRLTSSEQELTKAARPEVVTPKSRTSKRKRGLNNYSSSERSRKRASATDGVSAREGKGEVLIKQHKSEGPLSAASAAAAAVPDPQLGLATLRQLHLYKSLYRRHHMIRHSWTSGEVEPGHVAFAAHPHNVITCLQFDEDKIITGSDDTLIHVYDTKTGKLRKKLEGHEGGVWALQYEGNILVSGSTDRSVRVWDIERGLCQQVFYGHTSTVRCLQILMPTEIGKDLDGSAIVKPEKPLIITGSRDSQLRVWRLPEVGSKRYIQTGPPAHESDCPYFIRVMTGHTHSVRAISAHGDTLVSGSYDSSVRVWRISTGESLHVLHGHTQKVYSVVLDHERNRCISGSMDSLVKIWDLATGACLYTLEGHSLLVGLLDLRDERLVSAAADSTLRIWDPENGRCRHTLMAHTGAITCFQHDGQKVISGSEKTVKMWDVRTGECVKDLLTDLSGVWQVKFDERRCVAAVQRGQLTYVEILDFGAVRDGQPPTELGTRVVLNEPEVQALLEDEG